MESTRTRRLAITMLTPGQTILGFEVLGALGAGGMAEVYRARDTRLDREVALKVLPADVAADADRRRRLAREAHALAQLNHPHVAQIYGCHENGDSLFLSLELVDGEDLATRLLRGPLPVDEVIAFGRQIAEGLEALHEAGMVHRDLKPANVRITPAGTVKILDFGLAKTASRLDDRAHGVATTVPVEPPITIAGVVLGTPVYMSPEQARGQPVDRRADI
jgi:serine/threonine protein kinase